MKKIFTFAAAALMAVSAFAAKETVLDINYAQLAVDNVTYEQGLTAVRNTEVSKKVGEDKVYPFSIEGVLEQNDVYAQRACLLRYKNTTTIGLFGDANYTTAFAIVNLKANDVVEIAYNNGSKDAEALTGIENMVQDEAEGEYVFNFTLNDAAKTLKYTVNTFTASADGQANFILPAGHLIAYIKVTRGEDDPEPEKEYAEAWSVNYSQLAVDNVTYEQGLTAVRNTDVSQKVGDVKVYPFSIEGVLEQNDVYTQRACLLRYRNTTTIGLFGDANYTTAFAIVNLKANDVIEIAYNNGGKATEALTDVENMVKDEAEGEYVFNFTLEAAAKTLKYTVNTFTVSADGQANFILPAGHLIAYIKVLREKEQETPSTPTAIDDVESSVKAVKMIENGQVVIVRDGVKYNVLGAKL